MTDKDAPALATVAPSPNEDESLAASAAGRDLLGSFCFYLHFAVMITIVAGWAVPFQGFLLFYLVFIPLMLTTWLLNRNSCVLNNIESFLRYGTWRSEQNTEEGAWLLTLIRNLTGIALKTWQVDLLTYGVLLALWLAALSHYAGWW
ncbi:MAG TPA: hypothetical protein VG889_03185 [Rhizomicrobium sp.]|nr:hypothetical protein [Rhizomicrobium sp.]